jgi:IS1 family transposase/transposase-like protein
MLLLGVLIIMMCPYCYSDVCVKNGSNSVGTPKFLCKECHRQFVENPIQSRISDEKKALIDKLLLERISLAGIARVVGVSQRWLQYYVNEKYNSIPREVKVIAKSTFRLTIQCDELWSFVGKRDNKQWVWLALDRDTREIVGVHIGDRSAQAAQALWDSLPSIYQQQAIAYTDFWEAYHLIFPEARHHAVGKESGKTNHIERFNCTLRQRISRLVRKTLSFSKIIENHIGAIFYFIHHYNTTLQLKAKTS